MLFLNLSSAVKYNIWWCQVDSQFSLLQSNQKQWKSLQPNKFWTTSKYAPLESEVVQRLFCGTIILSSFAECLKYPNWSEATPYSSVPYECKLTDTLLWKALHKNQTLDLFYRTFQSTISRYWACITHNMVQSFFLCFFFFSFLRCSSFSSIFPKYLAMEPKTMGQGLPSAELWQSLGWVMQS